MQRTGWARLTAMQDLYDHDFYEWAGRQAKLLRAGQVDQADIAHIAEEIESMSRHELRELEDRLAVLYAHLLKWRSQPSQRSRHWELTIKQERRVLRRHLARSPSLQEQLAQAHKDAYGDAVLEAASETGLPEQTFPDDCPFTPQQALDDAWWPA